ncbi:MAG TPA: MFS transporter [Anaerolineaceae bacterium]
MEETRSQTQKSKIGLLILAYSAFIALGSPDGLMGVAWPSIRRDFGVPIDYLGFQMFAATTGYLTSSFFSGRVMARLGVGRLLALSCFLTGAVLVGYTLAPGWWVMVGLAVFAGLGAGSIDAGLNTYIASEHNEGLMQWLHASYGIGITTGPIIMTAGLANFNSWRWGYTIVALIQVTLALAFTATISMWKRDNTPAAEEKDRRLLDYKTSMRETLLQPSVWLSVLLFFIYTGVEIALGAWAYSLLTESRGIAPQAAGLVAGSYWGTFTLGRMLAGLYTQRISLDTLLRGSILTALAGALLLWWNPAPWASLVAVAIIGFAIAPIFPGLVSGTKARVQPKYAANTIGIQLSGAGLGGAAIPALAGVIARNSSLEAVPFYLVVLLGLLLALYLFATPQKATQNA